MDRLRNIAEGVFFSLLTYGIQVYGGVWGLDNFNTAEAATKAFTKEDNNKLQVIMNKVLRSLTGLPNDTPVSLLLQESGYLSVQQLTAYNTLSTLFKVKKNKFWQNQPKVFQPKYDLSASRQIFIHQAQKLYNILPESGINAKNVAIFKKSVKSWIKSNIPAKPP